MKDLFLEIYLYFKQRKKFWLIPIVIFFLLLGFIIIMGPVSIIAPFVYTIF